MNPIDSSQNLELIAALADGRLSADERARALKLLADSDEALELFAATLRHQAETSDARVIPIGSRRPFRGWRMIAPLAAAAALALVAVPTLMRRGSQADPAKAYAAELTDDPHFVGGLRPNWDQRWAVTRGAEQPVAAAGARLVASPEANRLAFRLGVRSVDLQVALSRGDTAGAARLTNEIIQTLPGIPYSELVGASYEGVRTHLITDTRGQSIDRASGADRDLRDLLGKKASASYSFGQWSAAADLAAQTRNASFFRSNQGRTFLHSTAAESLAGEDAEALRAIDARVKQGLTDPALDEIHGILGSMIRRRGG